ncbi:MAG: nucleotide exchange factor GrpE [Deltaproteobacteria bacterium RIFCSPLOWO2_02_56_12]|nr:MAG: nucleotide exchange factor GrpE [Deltaproteobacteria bacterium RIFCSPLOWO2_02_56_12]
MDEKIKKSNGETTVEGAAEEPSTPGAEEQALASELEKLRGQLEAKEMEAKGNYDRFLRQVAELENFKKRMTREKGETIRYANENIIRDLLPVLDNLERAVGHAKGGGNGKPLLEGVEMVLKGFLDVLNKHGVTQISAKGELFDPERHEAIAQVESEEHKPNTVMEEHHKGYYLLDRLLRPSLVSVAKPPEAKEKKEEDEEVEKGGRDD